MANEEHVKIVKAGKVAIAKWRKENHNTRLDLKGANLRGANLRDAILVGSDLTDAKLTGANLESAQLTGAMIEGDEFGEGVFEGADKIRLALLARGAVLEVATIGEEAPPAPDSQLLGLHIDPGSAPPELLASLFQGINELYKALGGSGLKHVPEHDRVTQVEDSHV